MVFSYLTGLVSGFAGWTFGVIPLFCEFILRDFRQNVKQGFSGFIENLSGAFNAVKMGKAVQRSLAFWVILAGESARLPAH